MLAKINVEPCNLLKHLIPDLNILHLASETVHTLFYQSKTLYWAYHDEELAAVVPCVSDSFEEDWSNTFRHFTTDKRGCKVVLALGRYANLNLSMEKDSLFVGAGDGKYAILSGRLKIDSSFVSLGKCISGNSPSIVVGNKTFFSMGMDCMIAHDVRIRNTSGHVFIRLSANEPLATITQQFNTYAGNVVIEPHVWFGESARVFFPRDARIGLGSIVKFAGLATSGCEQFMSFDVNGNTHPISSIWARSCKKRDIEMAKILLEKRDAIASCNPFGLLQKKNQVDLILEILTNFACIFVA